MPEIRFTTDDARAAALTDQANAELAEDERPATASSVAKGIIESAADRARRSQLLEWFQGVGADKMQKIHDANQGG